jgi:hypothetical protein
MVTKNLNTPSRLYHYQSGEIDYANSLLIDGKIKLATLNELNDPWDCRPVFRKPKNKEEKKLVNTWVENWVIKKEPNKKGIDLINAIKHHQNFPDIILKMMQESAELSYDEFTHIFGIYSLTTKPNNILMWGHYARNHTGICIEYNFEKFEEGTIIKVEYLKEIAFVTPEQYSEKAAQIKAIDWKYEDEYRLVCDLRTANIEDNKFFHYIDIGTISSIILGAKMLADKKEEIKKKFSLLSSHIKIREARISQERYGLEIS